MCFCITAAITVLVHAIAPVAHDTTSRSINLVIVVNGKVAVGSVSGLRLIARDAAGKVDQSEYMYYVPGELRVSEAHLDWFGSEERDSVYLAFNVSEYQGDRHEMRHYEIDFHRWWLDQTFIILYVYDLNERRYRRLYDPLPGKDYTYEMDYSHIGMRRIKRK